MRLNKIRRSQLVAPFGPGALHILEGGVSVVTGGLDGWFRDRSGNPADPSELAKGVLVVREPRLEAPLGVSHFRLAPGPENRAGEDDPELITPVYRFPTWFVCPRCYRMKHSKLTQNGHLTCGHGECKGRRLTQVRFAAVCDHGHLQDFPWLEWVHRSRGSFESCANSLIYEAEGSGSLESIQIRCEKCKKSRSLRGVMGGDFDSTANNPNGWSGLSRFLLSQGDGETTGSGTDDFLCQGKKSWQGDVPDDKCSRPLRAVLINATNVHYADIRSAIHIPPRYRPSRNELAVILDKSGFRQHIAICREVFADLSAIVKSLRTKDSPNNPLLSDYSDEDIEAVLRGHDEAPPSNSKGDALPEGSRAEQEQVIRRDEYQAFLGETDREGRLVLRHVPITGLPSKLEGFVDRIVAVEKLRETRVFAGFSRLLGTRPDGAPSSAHMLWHRVPADMSNRWLPAAVVHGEGIFLTFSEDRIRQWETHPKVEKHLAILQENHNSCSLRYGWEPMTVAPRLVLLHTLAHLLINRLVFECGYGSASLRERLYVSEDPINPMAGILVYTAAGDSEGTLGGLVRLAEPNTIGRILVNALDDAQWCSADPVCSEAAKAHGQGPDSLNLAACHSCALLPETSCEHFNKLLDRSVILEGAAPSIFGGE